MNTSHRLWWLTSVTLMLMSVSAQAQDADVLDAQVALDEQARAAAADGRLEQSIVLLKSALELGELNILYLNLGRAQFKAGRCQAALTSYAKALTAPSAPSPPAPAPAEIATAVERYRAELATSCPGYLKVTCDPDDRDIEVRVGAASLSCGQMIELAPGEHTVLGRRGDEQIEVTVKVAAMSEVSVPLSFETSKPEPVAAPPPGPPPVVKAAPPVIDPSPPAVVRDEAPGKRQVYSWVLASSGGVLLVGGAAVLATTAGDLDDIRAVSATPGGSLEEYDDLKARIEAKRLWSGILMGTGGAMTAASLVLMLMGDEDDEIGSNELRWGISPVGVSVSGQF